MNHGKNYNRGANFWGNCIQDNQEKEQDVNVDLLCKV